MPVATSIIRDVFADVEAVNGGRSSASAGQPALKASGRELPLRGAGPPEARGGCWLGKAGRPVRTGRAGAGRRVEGGCRGLLCLFARDLVPMRIYRVFRDCARLYVRVWPCMMVPMREMLVL